MSSFSPTWRYHAEKDPVLCKSQEQLDALGSEWVVSPKLVKSEPEPEQVIESAMEIASAPRKRGRRKAL